MQIIKEFNNVTPDVLIRVKSSFEERIKKYVEENGQILNIYLIFCWSFKNNVEYLKLWFKICFCLFSSLLYTY